MEAVCPVIDWCPECTILSPAKYEKKAENLNHIEVTSLNVYILVHKNPSLKDIFFKRLVLPEPSSC